MQSPPTRTELCSPRRRNLQSERRFQSRDFRTIYTDFDSIALSRRFNAAPLPKPTKGWTVPTTHN